MTNISRDPLLRAIYDAAQAVEACGASEALTAAVIAVTAIYQHAERVLDERDAALTLVAELVQIEDDDHELTVERLYGKPHTPEHKARELDLRQRRLEAWRAARNHFTGYERREDE